MKYFTFVLGFMLILNINEAYSQTDTDASKPYSLKPGKYSVGFQLLEEPDHSRMVTGGTLPSTAHPRPIRTYIWYPARVSDDVKPMHFSRYAALADDDIWPDKMAGELRTKLKYSHRSLARSLGPEGFKTLLKRPALAIENAKALEGPFPLIVTGQGLAFESPVAFAALSEYLAGRGFVVATCPLVGTNSPIVNVDVQGLETEVRDLEFVIARARRFSFVSPDKLGVFGFDQGGFVGLILAMRNADVDAFVSVSSAVAMPPKTLGYLEASPHYNPFALRIPWLHSQPVDWGPLPVDSLFETAIYSERYLLTTKEMDHADYTSYALIEGRNKMQEGYSAATPEAIKGYKALCYYIYEFFSACLMGDTESLAFLAKQPKESIPDSTMTLDHRLAKSASITYAEFVQAVIAGQADRAIDEVRTLRKTEPNHILLKDMTLARLVFSLGATWGFAKELIPVFKFWAELYPSSAPTQMMFAESYITIGDYPIAIELYNILQNQNPDNSKIKTRLEWLHSQ